MGKPYKNPPIMEAVCEFRFTEQEWDATVPGLLYEELKGEYPEKKPMESQVAIVPEGSDTGVTFPVHSIQFRSSDDKAVIGLREQSFAVSRLAPYKNWEDFRAQIERAYSAYLPVAKPAGIGRIGLRYINRIEFQSTEVRMSDYFNIRPFLGHGVPDSYTSFRVDVSFPHRDNKDVLRVQFLSEAPIEPGRMAILLDLDYFSNNLATKDAISSVEKAHEEVEKFFESAITDASRKLFNETGTPGQ